MENIMFLCALYNKVVDAKNCVNIDDSFITAMNQMDEMIDNFIKTKERK